MPLLFRLLIAAVVGALVGLLATSSSPAHCAYCPTFPCWNTSACGGECLCLQPQSWKPGRCMYISPYVVGR